MPELLTPITEDQVKASTLYQALDRTRGEVERTLAEERLGIYQTLPLPPAPDIVEVLTDAEGNILEKMQFPFIVWTRRDGNLKPVQVNSLEEYWRENENSDYCTVFGKGARLKHFSKVEGNPLSLAEWTFLRRQAGTLTGDSLDAPFEALQIEPTIALDLTPNTMLIDPALVTVGYGKDVAAIGTGVSTVDVLGTVDVYAQDSIGRILYNEIVVFNKDITLKSADPLVKIKVRNINPSSPGTIKYFHILEGGPNAGMYIVDHSGTLTIDGIIITAGGAGTTRGILKSGATACTVNINNCIFAGLDYGVDTNGSNTAFNVNHCLVAYISGAFAYYRRSGTATSNNCVFWGGGGNANDWVGTWGGDYNATTEAAGAPGVNSIHSLTKAGARLAIHYSPDGASLYPYDFRNMDGGASVLAGAGTPIGGVTTDIDGRPRSAVNPNIGPAEGFTGFAAAPPPVPTAAPIIG